ncbi:hypothetical protein AM588_10003429 [Phytophthora nicotianae]|uniref:PIPK domain-containing protein n=1 Tax=Phytophthora nicotianae TaxID=4792 RepID=A0A0W8D6M2_PHYNI|nr:hypothetical protein AM588_10003429 [Phytophthora nicotianae]
MDQLFIAWQLTALISSLLSSGAMVFFFIRYPSIRVHPGMVLMCIFMSVSIASIMRVGLHAWYILLNPDDVGGPIPATLSRIANEELGHDAGALEAYVPFFFWCYFFFSTSATLWFLMLALDLIFSLSNPFLPFNADNVKHHIFAWPAALLYCLFFRYVLGEFQSKLTAHVVLYFDLPAYIVLLYIGGALIQSRRRIRILESHAHATTERMAKRIRPTWGPHYHEYLQSNPNSMLCRYFGCHSISLPIGKRRMYFVVMQNLFNEGPVDQRFDLKGNRDRRQAVSATTMEGLIEVAKDRKAIGQLLMDIDFLKISTGISLSYANTAQQQDQLCSDFVFLASRGIIDYSILLGVRYENPEKRRSHQNGLTSHDQKEVYYIGIVDMLQRYNWRWTVQRWFLGCLLCKDTHDVSAVPPDEYATRLADFVREKLFDIQGNTSGPSFRNVHSRHIDSDRTGESGYSGESSRDASSLPTSMSVGILESSDLPSIEMQRLSVFSTSSLDVIGIEPSSSSSSPSVAYSSVCESPMEAPEIRKTTMFFV